MNEADEISLEDLQAAADFYDTLVCAECHSDEVEVMTWFAVNKEPTPIDPETLNDAISNGDTWCPQCHKNKVDLLSLSDLPPKEPSSPTSVPTTSSEVTPSEATTSRPTSSPSSASPTSPHGESASS